MYTIVCLTCSRKKTEKYGRSFKMLFLALNNQQKFCDSKLSRNKGNLGRPFSTSTGQSSFDLQYEKKLPMYDLSRSSMHVPHLTSVHTLCEVLRCAPIYFEPSVHGRTHTVLHNFMVRPYYTKRLECEWCMLSSCQLIHTCTCKVKFSHTDRVDDRTVFLPLQLTSQA